MNIHHLELFYYVAQHGGISEAVQVMNACSEQGLHFSPHTWTNGIGLTVNLHVFADSAESVAHALDQHGLSYKPYERRLKSRRDRTQTYAGFEFHHGEATVQATVFPVDGIRQAPISPIDGKPMKRADANAVRELLQLL